MFIRRQAEERLKHLAQNFRAVAVVGPRQSGKTTLVRQLFSNKPYINLDLPDNSAFFEEDPKGFLEQYKSGAIFDEAQNTPKLFSYLQEVIDNSEERGRFILTGSNNFLLNEKISQSLAGRIGYLDLLPLSLAELEGAGYTYSWQQLALKGGYPELHALSTDKTEWFAAYKRTYLERDVRLLMNIEKSRSFERFMSLCAGRVGQLLNMNSLAIDVGVDNTTINRWLGILQSSFVVFLLQPYHGNFNKRIVKTPKLYFYDTGLACHLLNIANEEVLSLSPFKGAVFENLVISELKKNRFNKGERQNLYFWRDNTGNEIDVVIDNEPAEPSAIEIKSGMTVTREFFKSLNFWKKLTDNASGQIIYTGEENQHRTFPVKSWKELTTL